jgi:hypothetical protein
LRQQTPEHCLKVTALALDGGVRRLVQHSPQIFIAFGGSTAVVLFGTFLFSGTGSHSRGQLPRRRKGTGPSVHFRDDLLRRIHSQSRHVRQSLHGILMGLHNLRDQAVELDDLLINQLQPLQFSFPCWQFSSCAMVTTSPMC